MATPPSTFPISTASFSSYAFNFDPLYASETVSQSANIAGGLGLLKRGTVLFGPAVGLPITVATLLTTAAGGSARCILAADIDTTGGQVTGLVYTQGKFLDNAMIFTSQGAAADVAQLWQFGIYVLTVEQRSGLLVPLMKLPATGGPLPQSLAPKDAAESVKQDVASIKAAMDAYRPEGAPPTILPWAASARTQTQPAWAEAAFGPSKLTPVQQAREDVAEESGDLATEQQKAVDELKAKQAEELGDLMKRQRQERENLSDRAQHAIQHAQEQEAKEHPPVAPQPGVRLPGAQAKQEPARHDLPKQEQPQTKHEPPEQPKTPKH